MGALATNFESEDKVMGNFMALCVKNGDRLYLPKILEELETLVSAKEGGRVVTLEFARHPAEKILAKMKGKFGPKDIIKIKINPSLVAGVRTTIGGEQELDLSLSSRLRKMFKSY